MVCEASDVGCLVLVWLTENDLVAANIAESIGKQLQNNGGVVGWTAGFVQRNAQTIIGLFGIAVGFVNWWRYREKILHERLAKYLKNQDARLDMARSDVLTALNRPGPGHRLSDPIFPVKEIRRVLRERRWDPSSSMAGMVRQSANTDLDKAIKRVKKKIKTATITLESYQEHLASAHILRGAIAVAAASEVTEKEKRIELNSLALDQFRTALEVPGFSEDIVTKEYEAHQLRKLGDLSLAEATYMELEKRAANVRNKRTQILHIARCRRYSAEIHQAIAIKEFHAGQRPSKGSSRAYDLMVSKDNALKPDGALVLREQFGPYQDWDSIEQGDIRYVTAFICRKRGFVDKEPEHLSKAETAYKSVLEQNPGKKWFPGEARTRLRRAAKDGLKRITDAKTGKYDTAWFLPSSLQEAKNPSQSISSPSSN